MIRFSFDEKSYEEFVQALHLAGLPEEQYISPLHNLVGKGTVMEEHICMGYTVIFLAVNRLMEQGSNGPPVLELSKNAVQMEGHLDMSL